MTARISSFASLSGGSVPLVDPRAGHSALPLSAEVARALASSCKCESLASELKVDLPDAAIALPMKSGF